MLLLPQQVLQQQIVDVIAARDRAIVALVSSMDFLYSIIDAEVHMCCCLQARVKLLLPRPLLQRGRTS